MTSTIYTSAPGNFDTDTMTLVLRSMSISLSGDDTFDDTLEEAQALIQRVNPEGAKTGKFFKITVEEVFPDPETESPDASVVLRNG